MPQDGCQHRRTGVDHCVWGGRRAAGELQVAVRDDCRETLVSESQLLRGRVLTALADAGLFRTATLAIPEAPPSA